MKENIGLIGIGLVGTALAENLIRAGYSVVGCDIDASKCRHLEKIGGHAVSTPIEVAAEVKRVFLSLMTTDIVREVLMGPDGLLQAHKPPIYVIDTTTGDPDGTVEMAWQLKQKGISFLDSPLSGSSKQIRNRQGVVMIGGDFEAYRKCKDLFGAIANDFAYIGPSGSGAKAKLVSNVILGLNRLVLAEGLVFAERFGFELSSFLELMKKTPAYSCSMDVKGRKMIEGDFSPQSRVTQHFKDLELTLRYAEKLGQPLPLTRLHKKILQDAIAAGDGELDNAAVVKHIRRLANRSGR
jgi:3-hydroxyisobutyrate dehydrogenase-like beta-hydroxyacid dehydrogenase